MKTNHLVVLLALGAIVGCSKPETIPATAATPSGTEGSGVAVTSPTPVSIAPPELVATAPAPPADFAALNKALQLWVPINGFPKDLNELVKAKFVPQLPPLPPGKKFAIDQANLRVILVDN